TESDAVEVENHVDVLVRGHAQLLSTSEETTLDRTRGETDNDYSSSLSGALHTGVVRGIRGLVQHRFVRHVRLVGVLIVDCNLRVRNQTITVADGVAR
ncbi:hypothetical protein PMAYCL1PPCAC_14917, partial [Pristionchus mayeri]